MAIQSNQRKFLKDRLARINNQQGTYNYPGSADFKLTKSPAVIEAEKRIARDGRIVQSFRNRQDSARKRLQERKRKMANDCESAILFGDVKKALKLLDKFESTKFYPAHRRNLKLKEK